MKSIRNVAVVGMGMVGIPSALVFAQHYDYVYGIQRESITGKEKIEQLNSGVYPFKGEEPHVKELLKKAIDGERFVCTSNFENIADCDAVTISVQTPFIDQYTPDYSHIKNAICDVARCIKEDTLVVIESTITPGSTETWVKHLISSVSGFDTDCYMLAHAPERVMPGKLIANLKCLDRCVGGIDMVSTTRACELYHPIMTKGRVIPMTATEAEVEKTAENAIRDLQIATSNQLALYCESMGINFYNVYNGIDSLRGYKVTRAMLKPGAGVGGSCLTKDGYHLEHGFNTHLVGLRDIPPIYQSLFMVAREINSYMPHHIINLLHSATSSLNNGNNGHDIDVALLGWAAIGDSGDYRNTPSKVVLEILGEGNDHVTIHDPYVENTDADKRVYDDIDDVLLYKDAIIIMTDHKEYYDLKPNKCKELMGVKHPIIIDGRNMVNPDKFISCGFIYRGVGRGDKNNHDVVG